jgi:hypothetical protein
MRLTTLSRVASSSLLLDPQPTLEFTLMVAGRPGPHDTKMSGAGASGEFIGTILLNRYLKLILGRGPVPCRRGGAIVALRR